MGHHPLDGDVTRALAAAACDFSAAFKLGRCGCHCAGIGLVAHLGVGKGQGIAVARPDVGAQIHAGHMQ